MSVVPTAIVLAIDPGEHIGYTILRVYNTDESVIGINTKTHKYIAGWRVECVESSSIRPETPAQTVDVMNHLLARVAFMDAERVFIVVEHFTFTRVSTYGNSRPAVELFGVIKALLWQKYPSLQLETRQTPADAKSCVNTSVLRELGIQQRGSGQTDHALMAGRHAVLAVARMRNRELSTDYNEMVRKIQAK